MSEDCLFCKIYSGEIPSTKVYEDGKVLGFEDLHPQAKIHLLFIHKQHTTNVNELMESSAEQLKDLFNAITKYSQDNDLLNGYRIVTNIGAQAGQTIFHTHFHLLAGERLGKFGK